MITLIEAAKSAERCQRNWDYSKPVSEDDIKKIVEIATTMPTKNNLAFYKLIVSTDKDFNRMCYRYAIDHKNKHFTNRKIHRNTQVTAPLLLVWIPADLNEIDNPFNQNWEDSYVTSVGISSGAAVLAANQLGYKTGFCGCFRTELILTEMKHRYNIPTPRFKRILAVGFGHPDENFNRVDCVLDGEHGYTAESVDKNISIKYIKKEKKA